MKLTFLRLAGAMLALIGLAALALALLVGEPIKNADMLGSVIAATCGLLAALLWAVDRQSRTMTSSDPSQLDLAQQALIEALTAQWKAEAGARGLHMTEPALVEWEVHNTISRWGWQRAQEYSERVGKLYEATLNGRLGILGAAGSGKSTFCLLLALKLLAEWNPSKPVPLLLSIASWNPNGELFERWVENRLNQTYSFLRDWRRYGSTAARSLSRSPSRLLFILDGLDEIAPGQRAKAIESLLAVAPSKRSLVFSSRQEDALFLSLGLSASKVELRGMPLARALEYCATPPRPAVARRDSRSFAWMASSLRKLRLRQSNGSRGIYSLVDASALRTKWSFVASTALAQPSGALARTLTTPLYASIARTTYASDSADPAELVGIAAAEGELGLRKRIVSRFVKSAIVAPPLRSGRTPLTLSHFFNSAWGSRRVVNGLRTLADFLTRRVERDFAWWQIHDLLSGRSWALVCGPIAAVLYGLTSELPSGLRRGFALGMTVAVIIGLTRRSVAGRHHGLLFGLSTCFGILLVGIVQIGLYPALIDATELGLGIGICVAMMERLTRDRRGAVQVSFLVGGALGVEMAVIDYFRYGLEDGIIRLATTGLGTSLVIALVSILALDLRFADVPAQPFRLNLSINSRIRPLLAHLVVGFSVGAIIAIGGGVVGGVRYAVSTEGGAGLSYGLGIGITYGLSVGLGIGVVGGFVKWLNLPVERSEASDPLATLRAARTTVAAYLIIPAFVGGTIMWSVSQPIGLISRDLTVNLGNVVHPWTGVSLGLCIGFVFSTCFTPWPTLLCTQTYLFIRGYGPPSIMSLAMAARDRELMRQEGAVYQFRHEAVQAAVKDLQ